MNLTWQDLTEDERERAQEAFDIARGRERIMYRRVGRRDEHDLIGEFERLLSALNGLSDEARAILGPLTPDYVRGDALPSNALENLHNHLQQLLACHEGKPGRAVQMARQEAVFELAQIWKERGGEVRLGQTYREKAGSNFNPNAFTRFLASCLLHLDDELQNERSAASAAHSVFKQQK